MSHRQPTQVDGGVKIEEKRDLIDALNASSHFAFLMLPK